MPRGYGGVGILWRKEMDSLITTLDIGNERIQCMEGKIYCKVNWDKLDKDKYQESIEKGIDALKIGSNTTDGISDAFSNINNIIDSATKSVAPAHKAFRKRPKLKVMNENIDHAIKAKKQAHALWKFQGRPADPCNELVINKKQTTYELRKQCRNEIAQRRINDREEIIQARVMDKKLFHKLISRQRGKLGKLIDELHVDQSSYSETNILEGWRIHFSNLAKKSNTSKFDIQYLDTVDSEYEHIIKICTDEREHSPVAIKELDEAIHKLNRNKSADIFGVTVESILYGGLKLNSSLLQIINAAFKTCIIPDILKVGTLSPIFKNKGNILDAKNCRGITITPTISKIIETMQNSVLIPKF
ncbi:unnamed protein product [Mytilus edulis]|uniref:Uncharacterized protein n=1 Tax=Mytilus edulis TaxID=6550 RepID=A0A8S3QLD5_MYTED|nr:unnamed protein product [Mytilus edulis]